jgi:hypothetical protein
MTVGSRISTTFRDIGGSLEARRRLSSYAESVVAEYPGLPLPIVSTWSIAPLDAMAVWALLATVDEEVVAVDVGAFVGVSAFVLSSHSLVKKVISIDPNPLVTDEVNEKAGALGTWLAPEDLPSDLRVLDVARCTLRRFMAEATKIEFFEGYLSPGTSQLESIANDPRKFDLGTLDERLPVFAFIDALHTPEGVSQDLTALFSAKPEAMAVLDDCRRYWGPFVQSGVCRFLEMHPDYEFALVADRCPSLASSNLGIVYLKGGPIGPAMDEFALSFGRAIDVIALIEREEQLTTQVAALYKEVTSLGKTTAVMREEFDAAKHRAVEAETDLRRVTGELQRASVRSQDLSTELADVRASRSWKVTAPIRRVSSLLHR